MKPVFTLKNIMRLLLYLWGLLLCHKLDSISAQTPLTQLDIRPTGNSSCRLMHSPYRVQQSLLIPKGAVLHIEAGVRLEFLPGTGLVVEGALRALGEPGSKITMTSTAAPPPPNMDPAVLSTLRDDALSFRREIRLVRGLDPSHGQIQLLHKLKWRSVCTHSYNWTAEDIRVACVQMGYSHGIFDTWTDHMNDTDYMALPRPRCSGSEASLFRCPEFQSAQVSRKVCEGHPDILIKCLRHSPPIQRRHWMGIQFTGAAFITQFPHDRTVEVNVTQSVLQHVDIFYAGSGVDGKPTSAIEAAGAPPIVRNCSVQFSAFNGLNFTHTTGAAQILESSFRWNKGHGVSINSTEGNVTLRHVVAEFNSNDGIHYVHNDTFLHLPDTFCTRAQLGRSQSYPIYLSGYHWKKDYSSKGEDCTQKFYVNDGYLLTIHFVLLEASDLSSGTLEIRDGAESTSPLLAILPISNGTRPESLNTNGNRVWIRFRAASRRYVRFVIKITAGTHRHYDLNISNSVILGNGGRGIAVSNLRSGVHIDNTIVRESAYLAGVHISGGVGDVNITRSVITKNHGDGVNITYVGGRRNITMSKITENHKRGLAISFNETRPYRSCNQDTQIVDSFIEQNLLGGILFGNFCSFDSMLNITNTSFVGNQGIAVDIWSCLSSNGSFKEPDGFVVPVRWNLPPTTIEHTRPNGRGVLNVLMDRNNFLDSYSLGLRLRPAANVYGRIGNNTFARHQRGVIWIQNMEFPFDDEWSHLSAELTISENNFHNNEGPFVVSLGLSENSPFQRLDFTYNYLRDNVIIPASKHIRRHRSEGIIIAGSSNVFVNLNSLDNPASPIWLACHLRHPGSVINVTHNWWGTTIEPVIYDRVFAGKDRYDLASVAFRPYLSRSDLFDPEAIAPPPEFRKPFVRGNLIGGLYGDRSAILSGDYVVETDIIIQRNAVLSIRAGTKLHFVAGIGLLCQGKIVVDGTLEQPVELDLKKADAFMGLAGNESTVRLVNGPNQYEGRVEVFVEGQWGTVCNEMWTQKDAGVVCRQLGMAHAPEDFMFGLLHYGPGTGPILMSNVNCDDWDWDLAHCPHDPLTEHTCAHLQDIGVKCRAPGWAGMRLPITAEQSIIDHTVFREAGVLDLDTQSMSSALQVDFNVNHRIKNCVFEENANAGLVIINNHLQSGENYLQGPRFRRNAGSGLVIRSPGLSVIDGEFAQNGRAAFLYDPTISRYQQREITAYLNPTKRNPWHTYVIPTQGTQLDVRMESNQEVLLMSTGRPHETNGTVMVSITMKDLSYVMGIQVLNAPTRFTTETMKIYNGDKKALDIETWLVDERVAHFPVTSVSYRIAIEFYSGPRPAGNIMILLSPMKRNDDQALRQFVTSLENCRFIKNKRAMEVVHYDLLDQHENPHDIFRRFNNETIRILRSAIDSSVEEGLKVTNYQPVINAYRSIDSPDYFSLKSLSQISYVVSETTFSKNGAGIIQVKDGFLNVEASGNIYHWTITKSAIMDSTGPAIVLDFPISLGKRSYAMWDKRYMRAESVRLEYEKALENYWNQAFEGLLYGRYDQQWVESEHLRRLGYQPFHPSTENLGPYAVHNLKAWNNVVRNNRNTFLKVDGDFLRMEFANNSIVNNLCPPSFGLFQVSGTEKELDISDNAFAENSCKFVIEIAITSHTGSTGRVPANLVRNDIRGNMQNGPPALGVPNTDPVSYAVAVKGLQRINMTSNLLSNPSMEYEFVSGLKTERLNMQLEVQHNWWGSTNTTAIRSRIFDFDDWNCYAYAQFVPFLSAPDLSAFLTVPDTNAQMLPPEQISVLGGRLTNSMILRKRSQPYIINRDLTIMPEATLTVEAGAKLSFFPNVGILVLGNLVAVGRDSDRIVFGPITRSSAQRAIFPVTLSQIKPASDIGNARLYGGKSHTEGYLELFNSTTNQWVPIWHPDFSVQDAKVVCRHLNQPTDDPQIWRGGRVENFRYVRTWMRPFYCLGSEATVHECALPLLQPHLYQTEAQEMENSYIFVRCQGRVLPVDVEHWGGIRFARPDYEYEESHLSDDDKSVLEEVDIIGAGMLHGMRASGAVEITNRNPRIEGVKITQSASNGAVVINPSANLNLHHFHAAKSALTGVTILLLRGDLKGGSTQSTFEPIKNQPHTPLGSLPPLTAQFMSGISLSSSMFSIVDICSPDKVVAVRKRLLVLFRYDPLSVRKDCVKIFQFASMRVLNRMPDLPASKIGFRLLEWNMYESEYLPNSDFLELFEGNVYNQTDYRFLARINATKNTRQTFESQKDSLTVHLSATVAPDFSTHGFIAEVVTLPPAYVGFSREARLNITSSTFIENRRGGLQLHTTGEFNPIIAVERCIFESNGEKVFHNFSTSYQAALINVQNTPQIEFHNNYFKANQGGLQVTAGSLTAATRTHIIVRANIFHANRLASALSITGGTSSLQEATVHRNIFFDNTAQFTDTIVLGKILANFSENQVLYNVGRYNLLLDGFRQARRAEYQTVIRNNFIRNRAYGRPELDLLDYRAQDRTVMYATGSGQLITGNLLNNPDSDFDLHVTNQTELFPVDPGVINAPINYWGSPVEAGVAGRIRDKQDSRWFYEVVYKPFHSSNTSLMDGKCFPGFGLLQDSCYIFIGGVATFSDAMLFCKLINASLPYADKMEFALSRFVHDRQRNFDWRRDSVWVQSHAVRVDQCVALRNQRLVKTIDCNEPRPFICERDPAFIVVARSWHTQLAYAIAVLIAAIALLVILLLVCCWAQKSKQRQKEALRRRDSIRESIRISRTSLAFNSTHNLNGGLSKSKSDLNQVLPSAISLHPEPRWEENGSIAKTSRTFNSSVEFSPDYDFFEARNDAIIFDPYFQNVRRPMKSHITPSDLTFNNVAYIDSSNSRTSTRTDTASDQTSTIEVKPDFVVAQSDDEDDSSASFRYLRTARVPVSVAPRQSQLLETDM